MNGNRCGPSLLIIRQLGPSFRQLFLWIPPVIIFLTDLAKHRSRLAGSEWLHSSRDWRYLIGAIVLILFAGIINYEVRDRQWEAWLVQPDHHFIDGVPMVTTTDAAFFLSHARDYQQSAPIGSFEESRIYPDHTDTYKARLGIGGQQKENQPVGATDIPLLSVLLAHTANLYTDGNLVLAGNLLIPFTLFMTGLAIGGMFWVAGYPAEGALASVGVGLSSTFFVRTSIGRIDTDQLFLFFLAICLSLALLASRERRTIQTLAYAILLALAVSVSKWWHHHPLIMVVVPITMVIGIYINQRRLLTPAMALLAYILAVNPNVFINALIGFGQNALARLTGQYFSSLPATGEGGLIFPNTFTTVTELNRLGFMETLGLIAPHPVLGVVGVAGFILWVIFFPRKGIIFLPFFILGLLSVSAGIRFAFFAAPFVWFGLAWILLSAVRWVVSKSPRGTDRTSFITVGATLFASALSLIGITAISLEGYIPSPAFSVPITKTFQSLRSENDGIIATWWDYGYYAHFHSGLNTYHDPGAQNGPRTHLFARGLTSADQGELIQIIKFVSSSGSNGIEENSGSLEELNSAIASSGIPDKPLYLVLTHQMADWMTSIATLGYYDVETGQYLSDDTLSLFIVRELDCEAVNQFQLRCGIGLLDIQQGTLDGNPVINEVAVIRDGSLVESDQKHENGAWVVVVRPLENGEASLGLLHRENWRNNYFRLFHQGRHDPRRMELVLDHYPIARVYRIIH